MTERPGESGSDLNISASSGRPGEQKGRAKGTTESLGKKQGNHLYIGARVAHRRSEPPGRFKISQVVVDREVHVRPPRTKRRNGEKGLGRWRMIHNLVAPVIAGGDSTTQS